MKSNTLLYVCAGAAVVLIGSAFYFLSSAPLATVSSTSSTPAPTQATGTTAPTSGTHGGPIVEENGMYRVGSSLIEKVDPAKYSSIPEKSKIDKEILAMSSRSDMAELERPKALLARMNALPPAAQVLAMEKATELIKDKEYVNLRPLLFSLSKSPELRETVLTDVLSRGDGVRMPTLVEMLRQPPNEAQEEVREILVAYLDRDPGNDLAQWDAAVRQFLIQNPEE